MGKKVGAIDIGTNSTRLLVAFVEAGRVRTLRTELVVTRLGQGIGTGRLRPDAVGRTTEVLKKYRSILRDEGVELVTAVATSAVRDAANRAAFLETVCRETGFVVRVLSGEEEASLGYLGVSVGLAVDPAEVIVIDVGGGSTEFIWTGANGLQFRSLNVGAVRMTEEGAGEDRITSLLMPIIRELAVFPAFSLVGVGGTVTTLAAMNERLAVYDSSLIHGYSLTFSNVTRLLGDIRQKSPAELRRTPGLQPERADIIEAGAAIVSVVMRELGREQITVSEADILHGLALRAAADVEIKSPTADLK